MGAAMASLGRGGRGEWIDFAIDSGEFPLGAVGKALENRERPRPGVSGSNVAISASAGERSL